jgi:hypothetical protein
VGDSSWNRVQELPVATPNKDPNSMKLTKKTWDSVRGTPQAKALRDAAVLWAGAYTGSEAGFAAIDQQLIEAALSLAADRSRFSRGYEAAVQDAIEIVEDNPYTSAPCGRRIAEQLFYRTRRASGSDFARMEDALWGLLQSVLSVGNRPKPLEQAIKVAGDLVTGIEKRRLRKKYTGPKRDRRGT